MEPETTPTQPNQGGTVVQPIPPVQSPPNTQSQDQSLDPSVLALTKSIGLAESGGNYNAPDKTGDGANSLGAYQMTPGFLENWAPKAGVQYNAGQPLSMAQQNEVAYKTVQTLGTTGDPNDPSLGKLSPAQIASYWNTGEPNAYLNPDYGKNNTYGSTSSYVNKVEQLYNENNQSTSSATSNDSNPEMGISEAIGGGTILAAALPWLLGPEAGIPADIAEGTAGATAEAGAIAGEGGNALDSIWNGLKSALGIGATVQEGQDVLSAVTGSNSNSSNAGTSTSSTSTTPDLSSFNQQAPEAIKSSSELASATSQALAGTIGGRKMLTDPNVQEAIGAMGQYGMAPTINENGIMDYSQAQKKATQNIHTLGNGVVEMLNAGGGVVPNSEAKQEAYRNIDSDNNLDESQRIEAKGAVDKYVQDYSEKYGDGNGNMAEGHMHKMKMEMGSGFDKNDSVPKNRAKRALSRGAKSTVLKHTRHKELYKKALKEEQKLINAKNIMKRLEQKKAPKNETLKKFLHTAGAKYLALYLGDKIGGPLGAVMGSLTAEYLTKVIDKKHGKTIFETPAVHKGLEILQKDNPEFYKVVESALKKRGIITPQPKTPKVIYGESPKRLQLNAPSHIPMPEHKPKQESAIVTHSKTHPKDYETAKAMKYGKPQYGGIYERNKEIEETKKAAFHEGKEPAPYKYIQGKRKALIKARVSHSRKYKG